MPAHLTIFCRTSPGSLAVADVRRAFDAVVDWYVQAELCGIQDEAVVDAARNAVTLEDHGSAVAIRYRGPDVRPIEVDLVTQESDVRTWCEEAAEDVDAEDGEGAEVILAHLRAATAIVDIELGWPEVEKMGVVFASAVAQHFARGYGGIIQDQNDDWFNVGEHHTVQIRVGPSDP